MDAVYREVHFHAVLFGGLKKREGVREEERGMQGVGWGGWLARGVWSGRVEEKTSTCTICRGGFVRFVHVVRIFFVPRALCAVGRAKKNKSSVFCFRAHAGRGGKGVSWRTGGSRLSRIVCVPCRRKEVFGGNKRRALCSRSPPLLKFFFSPAFFLFFVLLSCRDVFGFLCWIVWLSVR